LSSQPQNLHFGRAELRCAQRQLLIDEQPVALGSGAFEVLNLLVAHRDRVVGKDELIAAAGPGDIVDEEGLQLRIGTLRTLLGASAITSVAGQGYRFTAALTDEPQRVVQAKPFSVRPTARIGSITWITFLIALAAIAYGTWEFTRDRGQAPHARPIRSEAPAAEVPSGRERLHWIHVRRASHAPIRPFPEGRFL